MAHKDKIESAIQRLNADLKAAAADGVTVTLSVADRETLPPITVVQLTSVSPDR